MDTAAFVDLSRTVQSTGHVITSGSSFSQRQVQRRICNRSRMYTLGWEFLAVLKEHTLPPLICGTLRNSSYRRRL
jgi:hypothetical protein